MNAPHSCKSRQCAPRLSTPLLLMLWLLTTMTGCDMASINGDLDGQWRLRTITYRESGEEVAVTDRFYSFFRHTVNLTSSGTIANPGVTHGGNMWYRDTTLRLEFPSSYVTSLRNWGLDSKETTFEIETLTRHRLVMRSDYAVLVLEKF